MTQFRIASDLHLEKLIRSKLPHKHSEILPIMPNESEQVLLLVGDTVALTELSRYEAFFEGVSSRFQDVLMVHGNHEFWGSDVLLDDQKFMNYYADLDGGYDNIHMLENEVVHMLDDVAVFGATFWTNFNKRNPIDMAIANRHMPDHTHSYYDGKLFTAELAADVHEKTFEQIKKFVETCKEKGIKSVIMTHHLPTELASDPKFKGHALSPCFWSEYHDWILENGPDLWVCGHTHSSSDFMIGNTRIIVNPYGYRHFGGIENPCFNDKLVVEV